jgi:hypothetical protein
VKEFLAARRCGLTARQAAGQAISLALLRNGLVTALRVRFGQADRYADWD